MFSKISASSSPALSRAQLALTIFGVVLATVANSGSARAADFRSRIFAIGSNLSINGQIAVSVPGSNGSDRASSAADLLDRSGARHVDAIKVGHHRWALTTPAGSVVLLVTRLDARSERTTALALSKRWAARTNALLSLPAILILGLSQPIFIPTGETRAFRVGGAAMSSQLSVKTDSPSVIAPSFDPDNRTMVVRGAGPGKAAVTLTADDGNGGTTTRTITVVDEDRAGEIDGSAAATVTGSPAAPVDVVLQAARTALCRAVQLESPGSLEVIMPPTLSASLPSGSDTVVDATVRAVGSDLFPVEQTVAVHIHNDSAFPNESAQMLFYSNNPETVKHAQPLYEAAIPAFNHPVRLVYHHQNVTPGNLIMRIELVNVSLSPAVVHLIRGMSIPITDPVEAGTRAGENFLREWRANAGQDVQIPARTRLELLIQQIQPEEVSSGIVEIAETSGIANSLVLRVDAETPEAAADGFTALDSLADPEADAMLQLPLTDQFAQQVLNEPRSDQIYAAPFVATAGVYSVGSPWLRMNIGTKDAVIRQSGVGNGLAGNYGVVYSMNITINNTGTTPKNVVVSFESEAGTVSGLFIIDGATVESVNDLPPPNEQELTRTLVPAGASQTFQIQTIPLSGSAYPASIVVHAL